MSSQLSTPDQTTQGPGSLSPLPYGDQAQVARAKTATPEQLDKGIATTKWDAFVATVHSGLDSSGFGSYNYPGSMTRAYQEFAAAQDAEQQGIQKITPEEQNKKYPGINATTPEYPEVARRRYEENQRKMDLADTIARSPGLGWTSNFAAGLVSSALDPFNLIGNVGLGLVSGGGTIPASLSKMFAQNLVLGGVSGTANFLQTKKEGLNPDVLDTIEETIKSSAEAAIMFKGLHLAAGASAPYVKEGYGNALKFIGETKESVAKKLGIQIAQHELGGEPNIEPQNKALASRQNGEVQVGTVPDNYVYRSIGHPSERTHHVGIDSETGLPVPTIDLGEGVTGTDRGQQSNNLSSNPEGTLTGKVQSFEVAKEGKYLNIDQPIGEGEGKSFIKELESKLGTTIELPTNTSIHEAIQILTQEAEANGLKSETLSAIQDVAKEQGFKGYQFVTRDAAGNPASNNVHVFNPAEVTPSEVFNASKETTPQNSPEEVKQQILDAAQPENARTADPVREMEMAKLRKLPQPPEHEVSPITENNAQLAEAYLKEIADADPVLKAELDSFAEKEDKDVNKNQSLAKLLGNCMTGSNS